MPQADRSGASAGWAPRHPGLERALAVGAREPLPSPAVSETQGFDRLRIPSAPLRALPIRGAAAPSRAESGGPTPLRFSAAAASARVEEPVRAGRGTAAALLGLADRRSVRHRLPHR